jgi:hypothetical protein
MNETWIACTLHPPGDTTMKHGVPKAKVPAKAAHEDAVREVVGMRRWMRLTARKHSAAKRTDNDAAQAAADALNALLRDARKLG